MHLRRDDATYDPLQLALARAIVDAIRKDIEPLGLGAERTLGLSADIAFSIAMLFDGARSLTAPDVAGARLARPMAVFVVDKSDGGEAGDADTVGPERASWMHEYVHGIADDLLDEA